MAQFYLTSTIAQILCFFLSRLKNGSKGKISGLFSKFLDKKLQKVSNGTGLSNILKAELIKTALTRVKSNYHVAKRQTDEEYLELISEGGRSGQVLSLVLENSNILLRAKHPGIPGVAMPRP